ncbi:MAG: PE family protein, partial [Mycobacterium sp.]
MSSLVFASTGLLESASQNAAEIGSALEQAHARAAAVTKQIAAAAPDEVSTAITALFRDYGRRYQALSEQAAAFHSQFVATLTRGGLMYEVAEAANTVPLSGPALIPVNLELRVPVNPGLSFSLPAITLPQSTIPAFSGPGVSGGPITIPPVTIAATPVDITAGSTTRILGITGTVGPLTNLPLIDITPAPGFGGLGLIGLDAAINIPAIPVNLTMSVPSAMPLTGALGTIEIEAFSIPPFPLTLSGSAGWFDVISYNVAFSSVGPIPMGPITISSIPLSFGVGSSALAIPITGAIGGGSFPLADIQHGLGFGNSTVGPSPGLLNSGFGVTGSNAGGPGPLGGGTTISPSWIPLNLDVSVPIDLSITSSPLSFTVTVPEIPAIPVTGNFSADFIGIGIIDFPIVSPSAIGPIGVSPITVAVNPVDVTVGGPTTTLGIHATGGIGLVGMPVIDITATPGGLGAAIGVPATPIHLDVRVPIDIPLTGTIGSITVDPVSVSAVNVNLTNGQSGLSYDAITGAVGPIVTPSITVNPIDFNLMVGGPSSTAALTLTIVVGPVSVPIGGPGPGLFGLAPLTLPAVPVSLHATGPVDIPVTGTVGPITTTGGTVDVPQNFGLTLLGIIELPAISTTLSNPIPTGGQVLSVNFDLVQTLDLTVADTLRASGILGSGPWHLLLDSLSR